MKDGAYVLSFGGRAVGKVEVARQGLYYCFSCRCRLSGDIVCRVVAVWCGKRESLGVLTPEEEGFALKARLPVKRFGEEEPEFLVIPNRTVTAGKYVPIRPEAPFAYIERLKEAFLVRQNGGLSVRIPDQGAVGSSR